jgi:hypothetical protein
MDEKGNISILMRDGYVPSVLFTVKSLSTQALGALPYTK